MLPEIPTYPVRVRLPILWGEMDSLGHVNNTAYLRWFEEARIQYIHASGLANDGAPGVILAHQRCDYLLPLTYPGTIEARVSAIRLGRTSLTLSFVIHAVELGLDAAKGEGVLVAFDYADRQSIPVPEAVRARVIAFEQAGPGQFKVT